MKLNVISFVLLGYLRVFSLHAYQAPPSVGNNNDFSFMTAKDIQVQSSSGISIRKTSVGDVTINTLYIQSISTCGSGTECSSDWFDNEGDLYGALWTPVTVVNGQTADIGSGYLYNMMMNECYDGEINIDGQTNGSLSKTPGTDPGPNWKIKLGLSTQAATVETGGVTGRLVPILDAVFIIITCNDTTQTCVVNGASPNSRQDF